MNDLRDKLIIFNFNDGSIWGGGGYYEEIDPAIMFFHIKPKPRSFAHVIQSFARDIMAGKEVDVCGICREVKGAASQINSPGICVPCTIEDGIRAEKYRMAKMRW